MQIIKDFLKAVIISSMVLLLVGVAYAWTEPTSTPPTGNTSAPITTSGDPQYKPGPFGAEYIKSYKNTSLATELNDDYSLSTVGIGTTEPSAKLDVRGNAILSVNTGVGFPSGTGSSLTLQSRNDTVSTNPVGYTDCSAIPVSGINDSNYPSTSAEYTAVNNACSIIEDTSSTTNKYREEYACTSDDGGITYNDIKYYYHIYNSLSSTTTYYFQTSTVNCIAGTSNYSLQTNSGTLEFANNDGAVKLRLGQDGKLCFDATGDDCKSSWNDVNHWTLSGSNLYPKLTSYNVGIGTAAPNARLSFGTESTTNKIFLYDNTGDKYGFGVTPNLLSIYTGAADTSNRIGFGKYDGTTFTEWASIKGGNVGIGTTSPGEKLEVNNGTDNIKLSGSSITFSRNDINYLNAPTTGGSFLFTTVGGNRLRIAADGSVGIGSGLGYTTSIGSNPNGLVIQGNVGIGTTAPTNPLEVYNGDNTGVSSIKARKANAGNALFVVGESAGVNDVAIFKQTSTGWGDTGKTMLKFQNIKSGGTGWNFLQAYNDPDNSDDYDNLVFEVDGSGNVTAAKFTGDGSGLTGVNQYWTQKNVSSIDGLYSNNNKVWLGTSIAPTSADETTLSVENNSTNSAIYAKQNNLSGYAIYSQGGKNYFDGSVGIGADPDIYKLNVAGSALASSWNTSSDLRLKTSIAPLESSLNKILSLQGVNFEWKNNLGEKQIGFIAQDVEKIIPELVRTDTDGMKSLSYDRLTAVLVEAVKELKSENDSLKARIEKLESR